VTLENARDITIVVLGVLAILQLIVLLVLTIVIYKKVVPLLDKVGGVLDSAKAAATNAAGTSKFVGEAVVTPIIKVAGFAAGVRRGVSTLGRIVRRRE
jgi:hypothetical protein